MPWATMSFPGHKHDKQFYDSRLTLVLCNKAKVLNSSDDSGNRFVRTEPDRKPTISIYSTPPGVLSLYIPGEVYSNLWKKKTKIQINE